MEALHTALIQSLKDKTEELQRTQDALVVERQLNKEMGNRLKSLTTENKELYRRLADAQQLTFRNLTPSELYAYMPCEKEESTWLQASLKAISGVFSR